MPDVDDSPKNRWLARAAYALLAVALIIGLWRRPPPARRHQEPEPREKSPDEIFGTTSPEPPYVVSPSASRNVRWCTVRRVLERRCQRCHSSPTQSGAPFPLLTYADTQRDFPAGSGQGVFLRMNHAIRYRVMPPVALPLDPPVLPLDPPDRDVLLAWLEEGALALGGADGCGGKSSETLQ